jgi:hypothetical protein
MFVSKDEENVGSICMSRYLHERRKARFSLSYVRRQL